MTSEIHRLQKNSSWNQGPDPVIDVLGRDPSHRIFSQLDSRSLYSASLVNKKWKALVDHETLWINHISKVEFFGKRLWEKYFGEVGDIPPLIPILDVLSAPCPFFKGKKIEETHMLVLIPQKVNAIPLSLKTLGNLVKRPKEGSKGHPIPGYSSVEDFGLLSTASTHSHWVLMAKGVIEETRKQSYQEQERFIKQVAEVRGIPYTLPSVLDAAVCLFVHYVITGQHFLIEGSAMIQKDSSSVCTYTRCKELADSGTVIIGAGSRFGIRLHTVELNSFHYGVAPSCVLETETKLTPLKPGLYYP